VVLDEFGYLCEANPEPLFGRAQLAQVVDAFDFRISAAYWGLAKNPRLAVLVHSALGGLPGYRDVVSAGPSSLADFDE
jgi:uncharacterized protein